MAGVKVRANVLLQDAMEPSLARIAGTLRELGLSRHAAQTFCALVETTDPSAGELVRKTGIPDSKTYYALDEPAEKGLVQVQAGETKTHGRVPANEAETPTDPHGPQE